MNFIIQCNHTSIQIRGERSIIMTITHKKSNFRDYLEKIIFDKEELEEIRVIISRVCSGIETPDQLKSKLLESRARILNDIADFTTFYIENKFQNKNLRTQEKSVNYFSSSDYKSRLIHHLKNQNIPKWLNSVRKCILSFDPLIRNKEKFVDEFWGRLEEYHKKKVGIQRENMPEKIRDLSFPKFIEEKLINLNKIRNKKVHQRYELSEEQEFAFYFSYFLLLTHKIFISFSGTPQYDNHMMQILKDFFISPLKGDLKLCSCILDAVNFYFERIKREV